MKTLRFLFLLLAWNASAATTFTEWYVQTTGSNLNAGSTTANTAAYTAVNGNWDGTSVYTPVDGSTPASTVSVGDWASVYLDAATVAVYVAQVTTVAAGVNGAITLSTAAKGGTAPTSGATGRSIKVGGAWSGPSGAVGHPFGFVTATMTNVNTGIAQGFVPRVNFKSGTTYNVTAAMTHANAGPIRWQGYTTTPGDLGKAAIDGGATGTGYQMLLLSGANNDLVDFILSNNGNSGNVALLSVTGGECTINRVVAHDSRAAGISVGTSASTLIECEVYNTQKNAASGGISLGIAGSTAIRCISHDNTATAGVGFIVTATGSLINCISDSNGGAGANISATTTAFIIGCDFYNNTGSGIDFTGASAASFSVKNCNFIKNGAFGITSSGSAIRNGNIINCGFGAGTQVNSSGAINTGMGGMNEVGSITYANDVTPWTDPANGDFRISLTAAKGAGKGTFTQTAASYSGTIGYPDIGAAQHLDSGGSTEHSYPFVK